MSALPVAEPTRWEEKKAIKTNNMLLLKETSAKFGSPQFTAVYSPPSGMDPVLFKKGDKCQWRILATHGEKIILNITSLNIPDSINCQLDYLEVIFNFVKIVNW